jgi:uncharacterized membrane protein
MAFCAKCGAQVADGAGFCAGCGAAVGGQSVTTSTGAAVQTAQSTTSSGMTNNVAGCLCYLVGWITGLIFLVIDPYKNDKFVRFHAFQSIFFDVAVVGLFIALGILSTFLSIISRGAAGLIMLPLWPLLWLAFLGGKIYLMVKAYGNSKTKLPFIGDLAEKQAG